MVVVAVLAGVFACAAVLYLTLRPAQLPSFLPGHLSRSVGHASVYRTRAAVCALVAAVFAFVAWTDSSFGKRWRRHRRDAQHAHRSATRT